MIPRSSDLGSDRMIHRPADLFNPPALTNFLGCLQAALDPIAVQNLNFPPIGCGEMASGHLFIDDWLFAAGGQPIAFTWHPDRIERSATWRGVEVASTTVLAWGETAAVVHFTLRNVSGAERRLRWGLAFAGSVARSTDGWSQASAPIETGHAVAVDSPGVVTVVAPSGAASVQGLTGAATADTDERGVRCETVLGPGESVAATYIHAVGDDATGARDRYRRLATQPAVELERARREWDAELAAAFTPGNDRYSGSLPLLESDNADLRRLYLMGVLGVLYFKRQVPGAAVPRAYDTLMPRYWATTTFIWDYSLSSTVHALLDPAEMRGQLERWMSLDVHAAYGSSWLTGAPVGMWYSVNDHAMTALIDEYVRWSGDAAWLAGRPIEHLERYATSWRQFRTDRGLADYGGIGNLLECVSSYVHEVASLNAANVWNLRTVAGHLEGRDPARAAALRSEAGALLDRLWDLYADGEGWFNARQPDGRMLPVRHCYDLLMVLNLLPDAVSDRRRDEMVAFFQSQLRTPSWMRALSPADPDAITSLRPDHQWNGAYTAWPAYVAAGLFRIGRADLAAEWLRGLARSANQGPFAQAHFVEDFAPTEAGGAMKSSAEMPYINDWACSSGGAWARLVIESVFGVRATLEGVSADPQLAGLDPNARLRNLVHRGRLYDVDADGLHPSDG